MKKLLLLFAVLLTTVGAWAEGLYVMGEPTTTLTTGKYVLVAKSPAGIGPCVYSADFAGNRFYRFNNADESDATTDCVLESKYVWDVTVLDNGHINVKWANDNTKFFPKDNAKGQNFQGTTMAELVPEVKTIDGKDYIALTLEDNNIGYIHANTPGGFPNLSYWDGYSDGGTAVKFTIYPVEEATKTATFTYVYKLDGVEELREEVTAYVGAKFPDATKRPDYVAGTVPGGRVPADADGKEYVIDCSIVGLPFELSADYANAKWYYMTIRNGSKFVATSITIPYPNRTADSQHVLNDARWAFVGNPFDGIKVLNKEAGEGKYLGVDDKSNVVMLDTEKPWVLEKVNEGFVLLDAPGTTKYVHDLSGTLKIWNDGSAKTDGGSVLRVEESPILRVSTNNYIADVQEKYQSLSSNHQDVVGYYTSQSLEGLNTALENANALFEVTTSLPTGKISIGTMQTEMVPGQWYFVHTPRIPNQHVGPSNYAINGETIYGTYAGIIQSRGGLVTDNATGIVISSTDVINNLKNTEGVDANDYLKHMVRFVEVEGEEGAYKIQFGTGKWMAEGMGATVDEASAGKYNFYLPQFKGARNKQGRFAWNKYNMADRVDNNGAGNEAAFWETGEITENDYTTGIDEANPVAVNANQFYSQFTINDGQTIPEGKTVYDFLIDGNQSTYWHSSWQGGNVAANVHYLQISASEVLDGEYAVKLTRRNVNGDQITKLIVKGYTEAPTNQTTFNDGTELAELELPLGAQNETIISAAFDATGYKYLRFYSNTTAKVPNSNGGENRGYWHASEFNVYPLRMGGNNIWEIFDVAGVPVEAECTQAVQNVESALTGLDLILPEADKFYNIVSSCTDDHRAGQQVYVNNSGAMHFAKTTDGLASSIGHVFQFVPGADGKFKIYNVERGVYMQSVGTATETNVNNAKLVTIANMGKDNIVSIKPDGQNQMHAQDAQSKIVGWDNNSYTNGSAWKIVEVEDMNAVSHPVTIGNVEWATLVLGYNAVIPEGVEAYAVSNVGAESASLVKVEYVIPANEAVLLNGAAGPYEFKYSASASPVESNLLEGTVFDANIAANAYVLSAQGEPAVVGFYKAKLNLEEGTKFKNNAFKAYLPVVSEARFFVFDFGGTETAIEGIEAENTADAVVYDLAGRRVQKAQKGLYIVNGKKVVK